MGGLNSPLPAFSPEHMEALALFPLPSVVLFPRIQLPLHVFEPRYRQLVRHVVREKRPIAIPMLRPGFEADYADAPAVHEVAGAGWVVEHTPLPDGRSLIAVEGVTRVRLLDERAVPTMYRQARAEIFSTVWPDEPARLESAVDRLRSIALGVALQRSELAEPLHQLLKLADHPDALVDLLAAAFLEDIPLRQQILCEPSLERRLALATDGLAARLLPD